MEHLEHAPWDLELKLESKDPEDEFRPGPGRISGRPRAERLVMRLSHRGEEVLVLRSAWSHQLPLDPPAMFVKAIGSGGVLVHPLQVLVEQANRGAKG